MRYLLRPLKIYSKRRPLSMVLVRPSINLNGMLFSLHK